MKRTIVDCITENEHLREILLAQEGGIMKFLAEHVDTNGTAALFHDYQNHCVDLFFEKNKWDLHVVWEGDDMRRAALGDAEHLWRELRYWAALKPLLTDMPAETSEMVEEFVEQYLTYAYKQYRQRRYPEGMTPTEFYREVIGLYHPLGLAYKCMQIILKEHYGDSEEKASASDMLTEFMVREYLDQLTLGDFALIRQAVAEILAGKEKDECRQMGIDTLKQLRGFSQMIYTDVVVESLRDSADTMDDGRRKQECMMRADQRERDGDWLRDVAQRAVLEEYAKKQKHHSMRWHYALFVNLLTDIGHIWAAQLLVHGIDMKELETQFACILNPVNTPRYYVDKHYIDELPNQYFVSDDRRAEELLKRIGRKPHQKCYLKIADDAEEGEVKQKLFRAYQILAEEHFLNEERTTLATFTDVLTNNSNKKIVWLNDNTHKFLKELICVFLGLSKRYDHPAILTSNEKGKQWTFVEQHFIDEGGNKIQIRSNSTNIGKKDKAQFERILKKIYFTVKPAQ